MRYIAIVFIIFFSLCSLSFATGKPVTYMVSGQPYEGYYLSPSENAPLIMMVHDWDGLTEYEVKRARMLGELGFAVFAMDLFGAGIRPTEVKDKRQHTGELYKDREKMRALMNGALDAAASQGAGTDNVIAMGYCFGGAAVLEWARSGANLKGFASFHGGLSTPEGQDYSAVTGKVLVFHGTADKVVPMTQFAELAQALEIAGKPHEMVTYGGARHAFTVFGSDRYQQAADEKSWQRFLAFLNRTFSP